MKKKENYIVIDIGGTYIRITNLSSLNNPVFKKIKVFKLSHIFEKDFNNIVKIIKKINKQKITAIGISLPGTLNKQKDTLLWATNLAEWTNKNLKEKFKNEFNCNIFLENDGIAAAIGEAIYKKNHKNNFIFLIWGTGIGGSIVKSKTKFKVKKFLKEDYMNSIRKKYNGKGLLKKYGKNLSKLKSKEWDHIIYNFGKLIIDLSNKFKIKEVILGGGVALKQKRKLKSFSKKLKKNHNINLKITTLGDHHTFGLYGASALLYKNIKN